MRRMSATIYDRMAATGRRKMGALTVATCVMAFQGMGLALAGSLEPPASPTNPASAMYTLENIYHMLDNRTPATKRTGAFTEPTAGPTSGTMHTLNDIMALATNRAPVPRTGWTTIYCTGDDGYYTNGVAWPSTRFTTNAVATNCVTDNLTGLMWTKDANLCGEVYWGAAVTNCENFSVGGYSDWRLPNVLELHSLADYRQFPVTPGSPFTGVQSLYWTSTTVCGYPDRAFCVNFGGYPINQGPIKDSETHYVWPVRGGR